MKSRHIDVWLGVSFLIVFSIQHGLGFNLGSLEKLQRDDTYKTGTGLVLLGYLVFQWTLSYFRWKGHRVLSNWSRRWHTKLGLWGLLLFFLHAKDLGFAYTFVLSLVFVGNYALGILAPSQIGVRRRSYVVPWFLCHVLASVLIVFITACHVCIVAAYK